MDPVYFSDTAALVASALRDHADVGVPVTTRIPATRPDSFVLVRRVGGPRLNRVADEALLAVECWAPLPEVAHDLAQLCRGLIHGLRGTTVDGVAVYRTADVAGPQDLPDPVSEQPRYTFTVTVATRGSSVAPSWS